MRNFNNIFKSKECNDNPTTNNTNQKVLGLTWCTENDTFVFDLKNLVTLAEDLKPTKPNILRISVEFMIQLVWYLQLYYNLD